MVRRMVGFLSLGLEEGRDFGVWAGKMVLKKAGF
jgi:hypothetical protein